MANDTIHTNGTKQTYFLAFCIEQYKAAKNLDGAAVARLFAQKGLDNYLLKNYQVLHTQSHQWLVQDIDQYLKQHQDL